MGSLRFHWPSLAAVRNTHRERATAIHAVSTGRQFGIVFDDLVYYKRGHRQTSAGIFVEVIIMSEVQTRTSRASWRFTAIMKQPSGW